MVKRADMFENGYIGVCGGVGWGFNVSDVLVYFLDLFV